MEKVKKYLQNFLLMSMLFHLIVFITLNLQKINRENTVKESFIDMLPYQEYFIAPKAETKPQKIEEIINSQITQDKIASVPKERGQFERMELIQAEEKSLNIERILNKIPDNNINDEKLNDINRIDSWNELITSNKQNIGNEAWSAGERNKGKSEHDPADEKNNIFGRKKTIERFYYKDLHPMVPILSGLMERSGKITITTVKIWIGSNGRVFKAEIFKSSGYIELDQLALDSIKKRDFMPAVNEPVRIAVIEIDFTHIR